MKILIYFVLLVILIGCSVTDYYNIPQFSSVEEANMWIFKNFKYVEEGNHHGIDEILRTRFGNCKDLSEALIYICWNEGIGYGYKISVSRGRHQIAYINGQYYDPAWGSVGWRNEY